MTGYLIFAFVLICALVWLAIRSRAAKADAPASRPSSRGAGANPHEDVNIAVKWVDTIRREGATVAANDTVTISTQILDQPTFREDLTEAAWHQVSPPPVLTKNSSLPESIKAPELPELSSDPTDIDHQISALHKEATSRKGKDWPGAIAALEKAAVLDAAHSRWNDMTRMVRLPTFLQQAGRFDEAMAEFDRLTERIPAYVQEHSTTNNELARSATLHREYEILYDKMRLACKREKQHELAEKYAQKSAVHHEALGDLKELKRSKRKK